MQVAVRRLRGLLKKTGDHSGLLSLFCSHVPLHAVTPNFYFVIKVVHAQYLMGAYQKAQKIRDVSWTHSLIIFVCVHVGEGAAELLSMDNNAHLCAFLCLAFCALSLLPCVLYCMCCLSQKEKGDQCKKAARFLIRAHALVAPSLSAARKAPPARQGRVP